MSTFRTHCALRLGDNLCHLHFMRKLAEKYPAEHFIHYAHRDYLPQLIEVVSDLSNLQVCDLESVSDGSADYWGMKPRAGLESHNAWKNHCGYWQNHPKKNDWVNFSLEHFASLAKAMGLESPIQSTEDLLFDYPALRPQGGAQPAFDMLIINSRPMSRQMPGFNVADMESLVVELSKRYDCITTEHTRFNLSCTQNSNKTVSQIGWLSCFCKYIVMVSTGPSWPTFNVFNKHSVRWRLIMIESERINLSPNTEHANSAFAARQLLQERGLL